jgi:hypothetical protein
MDAVQVAGSLAWVAVAVGYAWTVRGLARMAHAPAPPDERRTTVIVPVEGRRVGAVLPAPKTSDDVAHPAAS